jgi:hypothetical protein
LLWTLGFRERPRDDRVRVVQPRGAGSLLAVNGLVAHAVSYCDTAALLFACADEAVSGLPA